MLYCTHCVQCWINIYSFRGAGNLTCNLTILNEVGDSVTCRSCSCPHEGNVSLTSQSRTQSFYTVMPNAVRKEGARVSLLFLTVKLKSSGNCDEDF